tara:strand:+ start:943 stop:1242 length:300 start_codon:yes stop_codon:yes gene_type:complete
MSSLLDHKVVFKEEYLSEKELVKIVSSLQQIYLKQQDLLADSLDLYQKAKFAESKILSDADIEIKKIKEEAENTINNLQSEYSTNINNYKSELRRLRGD